MREFIIKYGDLTIDFVDKNLHIILTVAIIVVVIAFIYTIRDFLIMDKKEGTLKKKFYNLQNRAFLATSVDSLMLLKKEMEKEKLWALKDLQEHAPSILIECFNLQFYILGKLHGIKKISTTTQEIKDAANS